MGIKQARSILSKIKHSCYHGIALNSLHDIVDHITLSEKFGSIIWKKNTGLNELQWNSDDTLLKLKVYACIHQYIPLVQKKSLL